MALRTRGDHMPFETGVKTEMITKISRTLSTTIAFDVQPKQGDCWRQCLCA